MGSITSWLAILLLLISMISGLEVSSSTSSDFSVNITMSSETVENLKKAGFQLYGFKAVKASIEGGVPLIWFATDQYLVHTTVQWSEDYQAYISTQLNPSSYEVIKPCSLKEFMNERLAIKDYKKDKLAITACSSESIKLGQKMVVDIYGNTTVMPNGNDSAISIVNQAENQWTCGISQALLNPLAFNPLSAFPLYGNSQCVITPLNKVILMFASYSLLRTGAVVLQSWGPSVLVDLTGVKSRNLNYDLNNAWSPSNQVWAKIIPVASEFTPLIIQ
jgi:hypothetical protein